MLIIFDWDGTILDSSDKIVACMQAGAREFGVEERAAEDIRNIIGLELSIAIAALYPELSADEVEALRAAYVRNFIWQISSPARCLLALKRACGL
jgi:phosphoglycolate phosphatase